MSAQLKTCPNCKKGIFQAANVCPYCGTVQNTVQPAHQQAYAPAPGYTQNARPSKDKLAAGLLAIFLGGFGVHHFYLGNVGLGLLYLLFFWTGIPLIVGIIEGIIYLATSDSVWLAKYPPLTY